MLANLIAFAASLIGLTSASAVTFQTMTSPVTGITYKLLPRGPFATADKSCDQIGGRLAELDANSGEVAWLGTWIGPGNPAWIGQLDGLPYKCTAVYAGGAVAIPKAKTGRGSCYNLESILCQLNTK